MRNKEAIMIMAVVLVAGIATATMTSDYQSIPPAAKDLHEALSRAEVTLQDAVKRAVEITGGIARNATMKPGNSSVVIEVETVTPEKVERIVLNGDGTVVERVRIPRFPGKKATGEMQITSTGLRYIDIVEGTGESPPDSTSSVTVHYTGYLNDGTKFDSSVDRGQPATFPLNRVISGWTEGVGSMKVGGTRKLIIPASLGYGSQGRPPTIPGDATLIFDVELLEIVPKNQ